MRECHSNVYGGKGGTNPRQNEKTNEYNNDIFQRGECEVTHIRHAVSIVFINQLGMRPLG